MKLRIYETAIRLSRLDLRRHQISVPKTGNDVRRKREHLHSTFELGRRTEAGEQSDEAVKWRRLLAELHLRSALGLSRVAI